MQSVADVFSAPSNWCDRRCERCPLAAECPVARRESQRRWAHEARGRDPDNPAIIMQDTRESLEFALRLVREVAEAEGIDLNAPRPPRPIVLDARRLQRAAMTLARCVADAKHAADPQPGSDVAELSRLTNTLVMKAARIAGHLDDQAEDEDETWAHDAAPNLLLLDRLKGDIRRELARIASDELAARIANALAELDRILGPLIEEIGEPARAVLQALEARGAAPSPFIGRPLARASERRRSTRG
jgi:hypothetical protein